MPAPPLHIIGAQIGASLLLFLGMIASAAGQGQPQSQKQPQTRPQAD